MKTLIFEQWPDGHHFNYLECITAALSEISDQVIVAMPREAANSGAFQRIRTALLSLGNVVFDEEVESLGRDSSKGPGRMVARNAYLAIKRSAPDYVVLPTADEFFVELAALFMTVGRARLKDIKIEAIIHNKRFGGAGGFLGNISVVARRIAAFSGVYSRVGFVNFLLWEQLPVRKFSENNCKFSIVGDPVPDPIRFSKLQARETLGLNPNVKYLGMVGALSGLKAVPETLAAFRYRSIQDESKLLLAGKMSRSYRELVHQEYGDLVTAGRVVCLDRFLSTEELWMAMAAIDVHCSVYNRFFGLSSLMLKSLAQDTPVIADNYGWTGEVVRKFGAGYAANIADKSEYADVMTRALQKSEEYRRTEAVDRLLRFHSVKNFTNCVTEGIAAAVGRKPSEEIMQWPWVVSILGCGIVHENSAS